MYTQTNNGFIISDDKQKLDIDLIYRYLSGESYWAKNIPFETVQKSIQGSVCFGVYENNKQIGFARVITDGATFGYLADVFILNEYRRRGLSKWLMQCILSHPHLQNFRRWMLATKDAHGLYSQFGFKPLENPERVMGLLLSAGYPEQTIKKENNS